MSGKQTTVACSLCGRRCELTFHHLIPRKMHRRPHFKNRYSREQLNTGVSLCRLCHNGIHELYDEMTLGKKLNTIEALRTDPAIRRLVSWVRKQRQRMHQ